MRLGESIGSGGRGHRAGDPLNRFSFEKSIGGREAGSLYFERGPVPCNDGDVVEGGFESIAAILAAWGEGKVGGRAMTWRFRSACTL